jgi:Flp pilus assembly pilin Flp
MKSRIEKHGMAGLYRCRLRRDRGATSIEYAILGSLIAAVIVLVVFNLGNQIRLLFDTVSKGW